MILNTQVFTHGYDQSCADAIEEALDNTGLFDSVSQSDLVISCTKNNTVVFTIDLDIYLNDTFITFNNTDGDITSGSMVWEKGNVSSEIKALNYRASVTTFGSSVYMAFTYTHSSAASGMHRVWGLYVGPTEDGNIGFYSVKTKATDGTSLSCDVWSTNSYTNVNTTCVNAPVTTSQTTVCTYPLAAIKKNGDVDVFTGAYGIRYSPPLHDITCNQVGVTPAKVTINNVDYLTDGVIMVELNGTSTT